MLGLNRNFFKGLPKSEQTCFERLCLKNNAQFGRARRGSFMAFWLKTHNVSGLFDALLPDPGRLVETGEVLKPGSRGFAVRVEIDGRSYFLKAYDCRGWVYRLRNALRRSRALHTWSVTWGFYKRGLPVPKPLICLEERRLRLLGRSYLFTEIVPEANDLEEVWSLSRRGDKIELLSRVGALMGKMHRTGCSHGDMKWNNILVLSGKTDPEVVFVDTDSARIASRPSRKRIRKDLDRFLRDLRKNEKDPFFSELFRKNWSIAFDGV